METFFDPRGDDVEARDATVLRHCRHCMIPMNGDYQRCLYYRDNHHRTCIRQGCTECALYCPYLNHKTAVVCTLPHMKTEEAVPRRTLPSVLSTEDLSR
jgi:hypothetical protein